MVDSSVWIDYFEGRITVETDVLERIAGGFIVIGDLIMAEVLQGFRREADFRRAQRIFATLEFCPMGGREMAIGAARNYRFLRQRGVTVRTTIDALIATSLRRAMSCFIAIAISTRLSIIWVFA